MTDRRVKRFVARSATAAAAFVLTAGLVQAQTPPPALTTSAGDPGMQALVAEVRALRVAMEQMMSAGPRIQLALIMLVAATDLAERAASPERTRRGSGGKRGSLLR